MAEAVDPYGHDRAVADPQWSDKWSSWCPQDRDAYLAGVPGWGPLKFKQMADILQGLPPRPSGWEAITMCLEEAYGAVSRLKWEIDHGHTPPALTPAELRAWCEARGFEVPAVLDSVPASTKQAGNAANADAATNRTTETLYPAWVPLPPHSHDKIDAPNKRPVGRPATAGMRNKRLVEIGEHFVRAEAQQGRVPRLDDVARHVGSDPEAAGMSPQSIRRRLSGKLPLEQAQHVAHQARERARRVVPVPNRGSTPRARR